MQFRFWLNKYLFLCQTKEKKNKFALGNPVQRTYLIFMDNPRRILMI